MEVHLNITLTIPLGM